MNKSIFSILVTAALLAVAGPVQSQENQIYTWTDENGVVHYVDTAPDNPKAVSMEAPEAYYPGTADAYPSGDETGGSQADQASSQPSESADNPGDEQNSAQNGAGAEEVSYAEQRRREIARKREESRLAQLERDRKCAAAREQVETLEPHRRVFFTNDQGEVERMDDVERVGKVEEAKKQMAKYCD